MDSNKKKSDKIDSKKKDKSKKRKKSDKNSLVDVSSEGDHNEDSVSLKINKNIDDIETVKSQAQIETEKPKAEMNSEDSDDEFKTKQIIDNVKNETLESGSSSSNAIKSGQSVDETTEQLVKSQEQITDKKTTKTEEKIREKKKSKESKKSIFKKGASDDDYDIEKDDSNEKSSKKRKAKKSKKLIATGSDVPQTGESLDCSDHVVSEDNTEEHTIVDLKDITTDKVMSKDSKKQKHDKLKKEKCVKAKDNKSEKIKSKDSKKKSKKDDKKKNKCKDESNLSEEMSLTLDDGAPMAMAADEVEEIEVNVIVGNDTETEPKIIVDHDNKTVHAQELETSNEQVEIATGISEGILTAHKSDDSRNGEETAILLADSTPLDTNSISTTDKCEIVANDQIVVPAGNTKSEKTRSVKARKDSANKKKKVKSQKHSYDVTEVSNSDHEDDQKKLSKKESKKKMKYQNNSDDVKEVSNSDHSENEHKKLSKKESKKKVDSSVSGKKTSKKEKKNSKKIKPPRGDGGRLLDSESSLGCLSRESENSLDRSRPRK